MKIGRRGFFGAMAAAACGLAVTLHIPDRFVPDNILHYRGVPLRFDECCQTNRIYFFSKSGTYVLGGEGISRL